MRRTFEPAYVKCMVGGASPSGSQLINGKVILHSPNLAY